MIEQKLPRGGFITEVQDSGKVVVKYSSYTSHNGMSKLMTSAELLAEARVLEKIAQELDKANQVYDDPTSPPIAYPEDVPF